MKVFYIRFFTLHFVKRSNFKVKKMLMLERDMN